MVVTERPRQTRARRQRRVVAVLCALLVCALAAIPSSARRAPRPAAHPGVAAVSALAPAPVPVPDAVSTTADRPADAVAGPHPAPSHRLTRLHLARAGRDGAWSTTLPPPAPSG